MSRLRPHPPTPLNHKTEHVNFLDRSHNAASRLRQCRIERLRVIHSPIIGRINGGSKIGGVERRKPAVGIFRNRFAHDVLPLLFREFRGWLYQRAAAKDVHQ
jgi:hypothetical protein